MELLESLGINGKLLLAQIINFVILLFLLKKFLYGPVINLLEERRNKIEQGLKNAEQAEQKLTQVNKDADEIRSKAYAEAKQIIDEAKAQATVEATRIIEKANHQAERIVKTAQEEAQLSKEKVFSEARGHISNLIILSLEKILGHQLDSNQKEKLTAKAVEEF
ncbi:MAG: ATP synthase subunit b [bacterium ADurb.Bin400]|nr:MAG: ATP synthase subunit b [bacterium ADurb.Bin400]